MIIALLILTVTMVSKSSVFALADTTSEVELELPYSRDVTDDTDDYAEDEEETEEEEDSEDSEEPSEMPTEEASEEATEEPTEEPSEDSTDEEDDTEDDNEDEYEDTEDDTYTDDEDDYCEDEEEDEIEWSHSFMNGYAAYYNDDKLDQLFNAEDAQLRSISANDIGLWLEDNDGCEYDSDEIEIKCKPVTKKGTDKINNKKFKYQERILKVTIKKIDDEKVSHLKFTISLNIEVVKIK